jgi:iron complex transport system ATP-binding protein
MTALLEAQDLWLPRRLHEVSLTLEPGMLTCLVGPNGSGKTSLLHAVAGIGRPKGSVRLAGEYPWTSRPARKARLLSFLPASRDVKWPLLARDLVALGGGSPEQIGRYAARLELEALLDRRMDRLSTGERSRVLIARALAPRPRLLLLDEPTANLDPLWQIRLMALLKEELGANEQAALVAMHDLDAAERWADRIVVMREGRIAAQGSPATIMGGATIANAFGIERSEGAWVEAARRLEDRRSLP